MHTREKWKRVNESPVPAGHDPQPLDVYLAKRFSYFTESDWRREIGEGRLFVNGETAEEQSIPVVREGDLVAWAGREIEEPSVDSAYRILFEDEYLLAIDKPGDLPVHPAGRYFNNTLTSFLEKDRSEKIFPVHRLDRETSGVILCARSSEAAARFQTALSNGEKSYLAIVQGNFPEGRLTVDMPLGPDKNSAVRKKRAAYPEAAEPAKTIFEKESGFSSFSLVRAHLETGRLHQIRAHLEYAGYPIIGDKIYGGDPSRFLRFIAEGLTEDLSSELILPRTALHSSCLELLHPFTQKKLSISAPLPTMFSDFIEREKMSG
jgi:RluA family pseudouridine synthase